MCQNKSSSTWAPDNPKILGDFMRKTMKPPHTYLSHDAAAVKSA